MNEIKIIDPLFCPLIRKPCVGQPCAAFTTHSEGRPDWGETVLLKKNGFLGETKTTHSLRMGFHVYILPMCRLVGGHDMMRVQVAKTVTEYEVEKPEWQENSIIVDPDNVKIVDTLPDPVKRAAEIRAQREAEKQ